MQKGDMRQLIEGEALAVADALHQCRYFVLGCKDLTVVTDHKPLLNILNDWSLADIQNKRLQNLKEKTLSYQFRYKNQLYKLDGVLMLNYRPYDQIS